MSDAPRCGNCALWKGPLGLPTDGYCEWKPADGSPVPIVMYGPISMHAGPCPCHAPKEPDK